MKYIFHVLYAILALFLTLTFFDAIPYYISPILFMIVILILSHFYKGKKKPLPTYFFWIALLFLIGTRIYWYIIQPVPLGYDAGWYKAIIENPFADWTKSIISLPLGVSFSILGKIIPSSVLVTWGMAFLSIFSGLGIYHFVRKVHGSQIALYAFVFFSVSYTQYMNFWWGYMKNIIGVFLLVFAYYCIAKKDWRWIVGSLVLVGLIHRPAFVIIGIYLLAVSLIEKRYILILHYISSGFLILLLNVDRILELYFPTSGPFGAGTFFGLSIYILYAGLYITLIWFSRKHKALIITAGVLLFLIVFELLFFDRLIIYLDLIVILLVALSFEKVPFKEIIIVLTGLFFLFGFIAELPLITPTEFESLSTDYGLLLVTDTSYSTFVGGYYAGSYIVPGLYGHPWNRSTWNTIWANSTYQSKMFGSFEEPLYLYKDTMIADSCKEKVNSDISRYTC